MEFERCLLTLVFFLILASTNTTAGIRAGSVKEQI
jgi:hypothetical protein